MIETIVLGLSAIGGIYGLIITLIMLGFLIGSTNQENFIIGFLSLFIGLFVLNTWLGIPIFVTLTSNILTAIASLIVFVSIGIVYTYFWRRPAFIEENKEGIQEKYRILTKNIPNYTMEEFLNSRDNSWSIRNNKNRVASWIFFWPFSITGQLITKPFNFIYYGIGKILEKSNDEQIKKILEK